MELLRSVGASLHSHNMDVLKQVYNELSSSYDQGLSGWATSSDVAHALRKCEVITIQHSGEIIPDFISWLACARSLYSVSQFWVDNSMFSVGSIDLSVSAFSIESRSIIN